MIGQLKLAIIASNGWLMSKTVTLFWLYPVNVLVYCWFQFTK